MSTKNIGRIFRKKVPENGLAGRRKKNKKKRTDQTERVIALGRRTREEIVKWNQMTALRFQTGRRHQTSPASLRGTAKETGKEEKNGGKE